MCVQLHEARDRRHGCGFWVRIHSFGTAVFVTDEREQVGWDCYVQWGSGVGPTQPGFGGYVFWGAVCCEEMKHQFIL